MNYRCVTPSGGGDLPEVSGYGEQAGSRWIKSHLVSDLPFGMTDFKEKAA